MAKVFNSGDKSYTDAFGFLEYYFKALDESYSFSCNVIQWMKYHVRIF